jgi:hypothetical protein
MARSSLSYRCEVRLRLQWRGLSQIGDQHDRSAIRTDAELYAFSRQPSTLPGGSSVAGHFAELLWGQEHRRSRRAELPDLLKTPACPMDSTLDPCLEARFSALLRGPIELSKRTPSLMTVSARSADRPSRKRVWPPGFTDSERCEQTRSPLKCLPPSPGPSAGQYAALHRWNFGQLTANASLSANFVFGFRSAPDEHPSDRASSISLLNTSVAPPCSRGASANSGQATRSCCPIWPHAPLSGRSTLARVG